MLLLQLLVEEVSDDAGEEVDAHVGDNEVKGEEKRRRRWRWWWLVPLILIGEGVWPGVCV